MKLLSISGENVGLLKGPFHFDFDPTLTTITGPIGCGKSTLVMMIKASLTNSLPGSASSWVSWGCKAKAASYFTVKWLHKGKILAVTKPLRDNAAFKQREIPRLRILDENGDILEDVTDYRDTSDRLHDIIQIPERVINTHLVVDQDSIVEPVNATAAKFQEVLHNLTKMSVMENVQALCREAKSSYVIPEVQTQLEEAEADMNRLAGEANALDLQIRKAQDAFSAADYPRILENIERLRLAQNNSVRRGQLEATKAQTVTEIEALEAKIANNRPTLTSMEQLVERWTLAYEDSKVYLATLEETKKRVAKQAELVNRAKKHVANKEARTPLPDPPEAQPLPADEYTNLEKDWHTELSQLHVTTESVQSQLRGHNKGTCPTCGNDMTLTDEELEEVKGRLVDVQIQIEELNEERAVVRAEQKAWEDYLVAKQREEEWQAAWEEKSADLRTQLEELGALPAVSPEEEARHRKVIQEYDHTVFQMRAVHRAILDAEVKLPILDEQLEYTNEQLSEIPDVIFVQSDLDAAEFTKSQAEDHQQKIIKAKAAFEVQAKEYGLAKEKVEVYKERVAQIEPIKVFRTILDRATDILHRDNLPKAVTTQYMAELNDRLTYYLELVGAEFEAWISADLEFLVRKADGLEHKASRLSGGQKQQASVAYLLAVSDVFAHQLGVLILDEPTGAMQEENSRDMAEAFSQVINLSQQMGRQFIIVTHSPSLASYGANIEMTDACNPWP
jgi:DNA repair exonuclease SbcCD ATPase subunit